MDSYGDGNTYRGMVCKDSEIKTIEINRYNADVERLVEAARERLEYGHNDTCTSRLIGGGCSCGHDKLKAALEPFKEVK